MLMKKNGKRILVSCLAAGLLFGSVPTFAESQGAQNGGQERGQMNGEMNGGMNGPMGGPMGGGNMNGGGMNGGGMGGGQAETDPELQAVIDETASKFEQFSYTDEETGITLEYSLYIPEGYEEDSDTLYPMVMFIPDATGGGKSASQIVEGYYGAAVWASDEDQEKHPSFVLVPAYTEVVTDDNWNASAQLDTTVSLIHDLTQTYRIDTGRLYTTGQSMGCMSSLYLNSTYPDLFAASLYVSGQWDISVLNALEDQTFFYVTAGGDAKASGGQDEVMALFDQDQVPYSYESWDAQLEEDTQNENVQAMIAEGNAAIDLSQKKLISSKDAVGYVVEHDINNVLQKQCFTLNDDLMDKYLKLADEKGAAMKLALPEEEQKSFKAQYEGAKALYTEACAKLNDEDFVKTHPEEAKVLP